MEKGNMRKAAFVLGLLYPTITLANVVWPALYLETRLFSWWAITLGLVIEYLFVRKLFNTSIIVALSATICANAASAIIGIALIPLSGLAWEITLGQVVNIVLDVGTFNPISWAATFLIACAINVSIEGLIYKYAFKLGFRYISVYFIWFMVANMASVGMALYSLTIVPVNL